MTTDYLRALTRPEHVRADLTPRQFVTPPEDGARTRIATAVPCAPAPSCDA